MNESASRPTLDFSHANFLPATNLLPATSMDLSAACDILYDLPSIVKPIDLSRLFPQPGPLEIELGSGDGSFLVNWAKANPNVNFIGLERLLGRVRKIGRKGRRAGLRNLRAVRIESVYFLQFLLPPACCSAIHVYFPDPWPKRRHQAKRIINEQFPALAQRALLPGGRVYLRTDNAPYYAQMSRVFQAAANFKATETPLNLSQLITDFEAEFNAQGIPTLRAAYQLRHPAA